MIKIIGFASLIGCKLRVRYNDVVTENQQHIKTCSSHSSLYLWKYRHSNLENTGKLMKTIYF